jgi:hypothetical protein
MSNPNGYQGGGAEYAPQRPMMRPAPSAPAYDAGAEPWGQAAAPGAATQSSPTGAPSLPLAEEGVVHLSRPYTAHGEQVQTIKFRRPTGRDVASCGYPFRVVQTSGSPDGMEYKVIPESVSKLIVALSSPPLPRSTVDTFDIRDWNACSARINGFFLE